MEKKVEPWHELVFICPGCGKEFQQRPVLFHVRLCPECKEKNSETIISLNGPGAAHGAGVRAELEGRVTTG